MPSSTYPNDIPEEEDRIHIITHNVKNREKIILVRKVPRQMLLNANNSIINDVSLISMESVKPRVNRNINEIAILCYSQIFEQYKFQIYFLNKVIIQYEPLICTSNRNLAFNLLERGSSSRKILFEILIEKARIEDIFLTFQPVETKKIYCDDQDIVLLPSNGVIMVNEFDETNINGYTHIKRNYLSNVLIDAMPLYHSKNEMKRRLGISDDESSLSQIPNKFVITAKPGRDQIYMLGMLSNLRQLNLNDLQLEIESFLAIILQLSDLRNLQYLKFSGNQVGSDGINAFTCVMRQLSELQYLNFCNDHINNKAMIALSSYLINIPNLLFFDLSRNQLEMKVWKNFQLM